MLKFHVCSVLFVAVLHVIQRCSNTYVRDLCFAFNEVSMVQQLAIWFVNFSNQRAEVKKYQNYRGDKETKRFFMAKQCRNLFHIVISKYPKMCSLAVFARNAIMKLHFNLFSFLLFSSLPSFLSIRGIDTVISMNARSCKYVLTIVPVIIREQRQSCRTFILIFNISRITFVFKDI